MGCPHRCHHCHIRVSLTKRADYFRKERRCPLCKGPLKYDKYRAQKEHKRRGKDGRKVTCFQSSCGYHFPHRRGSLWCHDYKGERTEQQYRERFSMYPEQG